jgi:hypothetical protein
VSNYFFNVSKILLIWKDISFEEISSPLIINGFCGGKVVETMIGNNVNFIFCAGESFARTKIENKQPFGGTCGIIIGGIASEIPERMAEWKSCSHDCSIFVSIPNIENMSGVGCDFSNTTGEKSWPIVQFNSAGNEITATTSSANTDESFFTRNVNALLTFPDRNGKITIPVAADTPSNDFTSKKSFVSSVRSYGASSVSRENVKCGYGFGWGRISIQNKIPQSATLGIPIPNPHRVAKTWVEPKFMSVSRRAKDAKTNPISNNGIAKIAHI